jgi:hypothetical protein
MKTSIKPLLVSFAVVVCLLFVNQRDAQAGVPAGPFTITVDENGSGSTSNVFGVVSLGFVLAADPGPGGLPGALTYIGLPFPGFVGDVLLLEPVTQQPTDLIRFNGDGTIVFYSDNTDGGGPARPLLGPAAEPFDLADIGLPGFFYANLVPIPEVGPEGNNGAVYTPLPGQPGYDPSLPTYTFISDIPEPGTVTLVGLSIAGLLAIVRRKK